MEMHVALYYKSRTYQLKSYFLECVYQTPFLDCIYEDMLNEVMQMCY